MSRIYDEEDLLKSIRSFVKSNINAQITLINTEKNDDYKIPVIVEDDRHFVFAGELLELPNSLFVQVAIDGDIEIKTNRTGKLSLPLITVEACFDDDKKPGTYFKSLRYMRAIYQTLLQFETSTFEVDDLSITKATPLAVTIRG